MKIIETVNDEMNAKFAGILAEAKKGKKKWNPNPWAVCHTTVDKKKNPKKYERCVMDVKKKQASTQADIKTAIRKPYLFTDAINAYLGIRRRLESGEITSAKDALSAFTDILRQEGKFDGLKPEDVKAFENVWLGVFSNDLAASQGTKADVDVVTSEVTAKNFSVQEAKNAEARKND